MKAEDYLPLTETSFFVLLSLANAPKHGYGIIKDVERVDRQRLGAVSVETLSPTELLTRYFEVKDVSPQRAQILLRYAEEVMAEEET